MLRPLGEDEVYTIMPTTFEPGKRGGFFLSVVTEADFVLHRDTGQPTASTSRGHGHHHRGDRDRS